MAHDAFARAYLATSFLLGERGEALLAVAGEYRELPLFRALTSDDQPTRIAALANELTRVGLALERGSSR